MNEPLATPQSNPTRDHSPDPETRESNQSLWLLAAAPLIWAVHFLACYLTAAIWCAKVASRDDSLGSVRVAIGVYTLLALGGIGWIAWVGYRRQSLGSAKTPYQADTPEDRHRFLGLATLLLAGLSAVATFFVALAAVFMEACH